MFGKKKPISGKEYAALLAQQSAVWDVQLRAVQAYKGVTQLTPTQIGLTFEYRGREIHCPWANIMMYERVG